jgi:parallel beta-helix repeat protein
MAFNFPRFTPPSGAVSITPGTDIQTIINSNPAGTVFLLKAGTYRLQSIRPKTGMSFYGEVSSEGKLLTTLNGSKPITNFQLSLRKNALGTNLYVSTGQTQAAIQTGLQPDGTTRNQSGWERSSYVHDVFIGEKPLRHAANIQSVVPGTFYFDYTNNQIFIADNPNGKIVEISDKSEAFSSSADSVKIKNLRIEKYANGMQQGAISAKANWLIEGNEVRLTHGTGISLNSGSIVRRNYVHTNGAKGIGGGGGNNVLIEDNEVAFNNFAKFAYGYDAAGIKASGDNNTIRGNYVHDNDARGIWIDVGSTNALIETNLVKNNTFLGIVYEVSSKGIIRNNKVGSNGQNTISGGFSSQILIQNSRDTKVYGNRVEVAPDYGSGINIIWQQRKPGEISVNNEVYSNQITYLGDSGQSGANSLLPQAIPEIWRQNKFFNNDYYFSSSSEDRRFVWGGQPRVNFSDFRNIYGQEQVSVTKISPP